MIEIAKPVLMHLIHPGQTTADDEFMFEMQARYNAGRTVRYVLSPSDAETLLTALKDFIKSQTSE